MHTTSFKFRALSHPISFFLRLELAATQYLNTFGAAAALTQ